ncbi:PIG-L deacetylase family protein [Streptomyces gilvosporeus]|uniref:PIG-L domain-containing protein n=1 Tax=Streptomyces gilvosporeus TaxID=553510 RepID=A0A1V0TJT7_9ACTN|nr:PIG-L family deacetylase [Streptomyces gilvosporeus]ARF53189.1 PIG-L domain-containing protein [Streptomyces gilvosporeus]
MFFHAHPDDEALLTAGTMARLAHQGHRVVLVLATAGEQGLASGELREQGLGEVRQREAYRSARLLGCARVVFLGYADSGRTAPASGTGPGRATRAPVPFAAADVDEAAHRLAAVLAEERADLLTVYDPGGGYGHPDHVQVHRVGYRAAELAGTPCVLEATVDRDLLLRGLRAAGWFYRFPPEFDRNAFRQAFAPGTEITHRVAVRRFWRAKRDSMTAHRSQATGGESERTLAALRRLPGPLFRYVLGTEWYIQRGLSATEVLDDPLTTLPRRRTSDSL